MELSVITLPLIASIISGFFGKYIGDRNSELITSFLVSVSAIISLVIWRADRIETAKNLWFYIKVKFYFNYANNKSKNTYKKIY